MSRVVVIFFFVIICFSVNAKVLFVSETGSSLNETVQKAESGDTIHIHEGIYHECDIVINKSLFIKGVGKPIINGMKKGYIFKIHADSIQISGIHFTNVGQSYIKDFAAILLNQCTYFKIYNNVFTRVFFGILIEKSEHGEIHHNLIASDATREASSGNGIHLWHSNNMQIHHNRISGVRDGIYFEFVSDSEIYENLSFNNLRYGLHFMFSNNNAYRTNIFSKNGAGVAVMFSKFIKMVDNVFRDNWGTASYGLLLKEIYDAEIIGNELVNNTIGINAEGSNRVRYANNDFKNNGWAIKIIGACYLNNFTNNNFYSNSFDLSYNTKVNDNIFNMNYWSGNTGYDIDNDGFADVPYRPVKLFSYIVNKTPETIVLMRSLFVQIIDFSEKVSPIFTPDELVDHKPRMTPVK